MKTPSQPVPVIGRVIDGKVRLLSVIGEGGMGAVYRGRQINLDRDVAVKLLKSQYLSSDDLVRRFYHEAKSAGSLRSRHVIGVLDFGRAPEGCYIIMELSEGTRLSSLLAKERVLTAARAVAIGAQVLSGLAEAHGKGIVHRDLKTDNILIEKDYDGRDFALILDFGIAKLSSSQSVQTALGAIFGTPSYMSPEQCSGAAADARSDLYAVGVILYEVLTGATPFGERPPTQLLLAHLKEPVPPILNKNPSIPPVLAELVMALLSKDRERRPATAEDARKALLASVSPQAKAMSADWSSFESTIMDIPGAEDDSEKTMPPAGEQMTVAPGGPMSVPVTELVVAIERAALQVKDAGTRKRLISAVKKALVDSGLWR